MWALVQMVRCSGPLGREFNAYRKYQNTRRDPISSGVGYGMKPYKPESIPLPKLDWGSLVRLIGKANAALARYDGILQGIVNPGVLLSPLTTQEAVLSSRIEGTQATLEEVLQFEAAPERKPERYEDIQEIINYRKAMNMAIGSLQKRPISLNLIKEIHSVLLDSARGRDKGRGNFRRIQDWIGRPGSPVEKATFVPPEPSGLMDHLSNLEKYVHHDEEDRLVQLAIVHAQFELIHPFIDGNGRVGRILIPLFLYEKEMLSSPMFYLSAYLEAHRERYYEKLKSISGQRDWHGWIRFFLTAVIEQAKSNSEKATAILKLFDRMKQEMPGIIRTQYVVQAIDALFDRPIFTSTEFVKRSGIPKPSGMRILAALQKEKRLVPIREGRGRRAAILMFSDLIAITEGKKLV